MSSLRHLGVVLMISVHVSHCVDRDQSADESHDEAHQKGQVVEPDMSSAQFTEMRFHVDNHDRRDDGKNRDPVLLRQDTLDGHVDHQYNLTGSDKVRCNRDVDVQIDRTSAVAEIGDDQIDRRRHNGRCRDVRNALANLLHMNTVQKSPDAHREDDEKWNAPPHNKRPPCVVDSYPFARL